MALQTNCADVLLRHYSVTQSPYVRGFAWWDGTVQSNSSSGSLGKMSCKSVNPVKIQISRFIETGHKQSTNSSEAQQLTTWNTTATCWDILLMDRQPDEQTQQDNIGSNVGNNTTNNVQMSLSQFIVRGNKFLCQRSNSLSLKVTWSPMKMNIKNNSLTSTYIRNFVQIGKNLLWMDRRTDGRTLTVALLGPLG